MMNHESQRGQPAASGAPAPEGAAIRERRGRRPAIARVASFVLTLVAALYALDLPQMIGWALFTEQYLAFLLALTLALVFMTLPVGQKPRSNRVPWYDWLAAAVGFLAAGYIAVNYPTMVNELVYKPLDGLIISVVLIVLTFEATRRCAGMGLTIIIMAFVLYGAFGDALPGPLASSPILLDRLAIYLAMDTNALLGLPLLVAGLIVLAFILMGQVLQHSGGADFFIDLALALVGKSRGGPGKIAVVSSALFGSVSGSAVANVASTGIITIPLMKRAGYAPHQAGAIEAVASTGGQLAPPVMGAAAFLMAEFLQVGYATVVIAAIIPSALYYLSVFCWVDLTAGREKIKPLDDLDAPRIRDLMKTGWHFPIPFIALAVGLFSFNLSAQLSALIGTGLLILSASTIGYRGKRMGFMDLMKAIEETGYAVLEVIVICAAAGLVIGVLNLTGLAFGLTLQLVALAGGSLFLLLVIAAAVSIVLGMGMPTVGVYVLLAGLIGPSLVQAGLDPIAAHLFLLYFGMLSMITPPVALASFTAASIASADFWKTGWQAVRIGWVAYMLPFIMVFEPGLVFQGTSGAIIWHTLGAIIGVVFITMAIVGFASRLLNPIERLLLVVGGLAAILPIHAYGDNGIVVTLGGFALCAAVYLRVRLSMPKAASLRDAKSA